MSRRSAGTARHEGTGPTTLRRERAQRGRTVEREGWIELRGDQERVVPFGVIVAVCVVLGTLMWAFGIYFLVRG